jgi:polyferredoxin
MYTLLADAVLLLHLAVVVFVVGGLIAIIAGSFSHWHWVRALWFRVTHLVAIGVVVAQAWLGQTCPLTTLESWLRVQSGDSAYSRGFIEHWVHALLFYEAPSWVFSLLYTFFAVIVLATWWYVPPRKGTSRPPAVKAP